MKYWIIIVVTTLLLVNSCTESKQELNPQKTNLPWFFQVDCKGQAFDSLLNYNDFLALFDTNNTLLTDNINVAKSSKIVYSFEQNLGDVILRKISDKRFELLERYIIPIGSVYGKFALIRYVLDVQQNSFEMDTSFVPQLGIYKYWSNHVVKEYDSYLSDPSYTSTDLDAVPHGALENIRYLMFNLTLAAVLEDCTPCRSRMAIIESDFPMVNKKEYRQNKDVCKTILRKFH